MTSEAPIEVKAIAKHWAGATGVNTLRSTGSEWVCISDDGLGYTTRQLDDGWWKSTCVVDRAEMLISPGGHWDGDGYYTPVNLWSGALDRGLWLLAKLHTHWTYNRRLPKNIQAPLDGLELNGADYIEIAELELALAKARHPQLPSRRDGEVKF